MSALAADPFPWGKALAISFALFVLVKLLYRGGGWVNLALLPLLAPLAAGKFVIFSLMGRTRPYWQRLLQSPEVSNAMVFRGRITQRESADRRHADRWELQGLRPQLTELLARWNTGHRWLEGPLQLAVPAGELMGICRLFTLPKALGVGADRRIYRDVERVLAFLRESSKSMPIEWTVINTIGLSGQISQGNADAELEESLRILRGTVFWRPARASPPTASPRP